MQEEPPQTTRPLHPPDSGRSFVLAEEFGNMCVIPLDRFEGAWLDAQAGYRISGAGEVGLHSIDDLADGIEELKSGLRSYIEELLESAGLMSVSGEWDLEQVWWHLREQDLIDGDQMPGDWRPSDEQLASVSVASGHFYESSGLRSERWAEELPDSVVSEFGGGGGGMFGDYFYFDWSDEAGITDALKRLGHHVVHEADVIEWSSWY